MPANALLEQTFQRERESNKNSNTGGAVGVVIVIVGADQSSQPCSLLPLVFTLCMPAIVCKLSAFSFPITYLHVYVCSSCFSFFFVHSPTHNPQYCSPPSALPHSPASFHH